jgi:predicted  nucleic acid-binding Zn-ribbon protein
MKYAAEQLGVDLETITGAQSKLTRTIGQALKGNKAAKDSFSKLGISLNKADGSMKSANEVFNEAIDALGGIEDEVVRDALAMDIFGKSARELNPLIKAGADEIENLKDKADEMGIVLSEEQVRNLEEFGDKMADMKAQIDAAGAKIGLAFLPLMEKMLELFEKILPHLTKFVENISDGFVNLPESVQMIILGVIGLLAALGPLLIFFGWIASAIGSIIAILPVITAGFATFWAVVTGPIGLIVLGVAALIAIFWLFGDDIKKIFNNVMKFLGGVINYVKDVFVKGFTDAFKGMSTIIKNIFDMVGNVIKGYVNFWISILNFVIDGFNKIKVKIPDWVPLLGGKTFGVNIPKIPALAEGGIVNSPTLALIGEAGPEAVVPLSKANNPMISDKPVNITLQVGSTELGKVVIDSLNRLSRQEGKLLLNI